MGSLHGGEFDKCSNNAKTIILRFEEPQTVIHHDVIHQMFGLEICEHHASSGFISSKVI